ncbi:hypothetical protein VPH35_006216 [Triticum aestivum]
MKPSLTLIVAWDLLEEDRVEFILWSLELCREALTTPSRRFFSLRGEGAETGGGPRMEEDKRAAIFPMNCLCSSRCKAAILAVIAETKPGPERFASASARLARCSSMDCWPNDPASLCLSAQSSPGGGWSCCEA